MLLQRDRHSHQRQKHDTTSTTTTPTTTTTMTTTESIPWPADATTTTTTATTTDGVVVCRWRVGRRHQNAHWLFLRFALTSNMCFYIFHLCLLLQILLHVFQLKSNCLLWPTAPRTRWHYLIPSDSQRQPDFIAGTIPNYSKYYN